jgi:hypothetical protein
VAVALFVVIIALVWYLAVTRKDVQAEDQSLDRLTAVRAD